MYIEGFEFEFEFKSRYIVDYIREVLYKHCCCYSDTRDVTSGNRHTHHTAIYTLCLCPTISLQQPLATASILLPILPLLYNQPHLAFSITANNISFTITTNHLPNTKQPTPPKQNRAQSVPSTSTATTRSSAPKQQFPHPRHNSYNHWCLQR
jgi:hypothetical protein